MSGLTSTGWETPTLEEILDDLFADQRNEPALGQTWSSDPDAPQTQLNSVTASTIRQIYEAVAAIYAGFDPASATGQQLNNLGVLVGITRRQATFSQTTLTLTLSAGAAEVPIGSQVASTANPNIIYETTEASPATATAVSRNITAQATVTGPQTFAAAGTLTTILTPVSGWTAVTNAADAVAGADAETEAEFRLRRQQASVSRSGTESALVSQLSQLSYVTGVTVLENVTPALDPVNGVTPQSFETIIEGTGIGTSEKNEIAQIIWNTKFAGIRASGTESGEATDLQNNPQTVLFTLPAAAPVQINVTLVTDSDYPGDTLFKTQLASVLNDREAGEDVLIGKVTAAIFGIAGVVNATGLQIALVGSTLATNDIPIAIRETATFSTTDMAVTSS